jgi:S1-C subfamily serine protease
MGSPDEQPPDEQPPDEQPPDEQPAADEQPPDEHAPAHRRSSRLTAAVVAVAVAVGGIGGFAITRSTQRGTGSATSSTATAASTTQKLTLAQIEAAVDPTLVDITAKLGNSATAAGTGMVISSTGEILTNNHVISGATDITVQIGGTGTKYTADIVGYDVTDDIAVLQIDHVSGLATIGTASAATVSANDAIVAIGNALGKQGTPTAVEQTITASDEDGSSAETLSGLIEFAADVQPGDSGGSLVNAYGQVVGMTTAASSAVRPMSTASTTTAYAIPIDRALAIAGRIKSGTESATIHIGEHGLLGVSVDGTVSSGVAVVGVQSGSAAARAGLTTGDLITEVSGQHVDSAAALSAALATTHVGDEITVTWQDTAGAGHTATVELTTGAA